ncbi:hypothetical protein [Pseudomonas chlororaphis]|uniref:Uncharacterized protein n=1 Tax=Pseudomonas chlororaphis TaxID=587753 RepID=A0A0D5Y0W9_9PSED|nr:hypothetical protein [Pseudomonas chlororaphis]AKA24685.1 hypothetical protein PCL1606_32340 [Pseudomonas chlororaphis]
MNQQYIPLTGIDCTIPWLPIDTTPRGKPRTDRTEDADGVDLQRLANASALLLRDSCDLMDVMGCKVRA